MRYERYPQLLRRERHPVAVPGALLGANACVDHRPLPCARVAVSVTGGAPLAYLGVPTAKRLGTSQWVQQERFLPIEVKNLFGTLRAAFPTMPRNDRSRRSYLIISISQYPNILYLVSCILYLAGMDCHQTVVW